MLTENELEVLLEVLLDFETDIPCQKLYGTDKYCERHCGINQTEPTKECWIRFAKEMADDSDSCD